MSSSSLSGLLDTNILIGVARANPLTVEWLQSQANARFGVPVLVFMEFVGGSRDATEQKRMLNILQPYPIIHLTASDSAWAQAQHTRYNLSHNVGIIDTLIASAAHRLEVPIYTLNLKHFTPLPGVKAIKPY
jgi:hypothetical protein